VDGVNKEFIVIINYVHSNIEICQPKKEMIIKRGFHRRLEVRDCIQKLQLLKLKNHHGNHQVRIIKLKMINKIIKFIMIIII
jgi:hypothetical protein